MSYKFSITAWGETLEDLSYSFGKYANGTKAVTIWSDSEGPYGKLTVAVEATVELTDDEIIVKDWSENEPLFARLVELNQIIPTGDSIQTGFVVAPVCKMRNELLAEANEFFGSL